MATHSMQRTATAQPLRRDMRAALAPGLIIVVAGAVQGDGALITAAHRNASAISDDQLSYPWAGATAITTSLIWGATQVLGGPGTGTHCGEESRDTSRPGGEDSPMRRAAATVTWVYAAAFGVPAIPVSIFLVKHGRLPELWGMFEMNGGPWSARFSDRTLVSLLFGLIALSLVAAWSAWLLWRQLQWSRSHVESRPAASTTTAAERLSTRRAVRTEIISSSTPATSRNGVGLRSSPQADG